MNSSTFLRVSRIVDRSPFIEFDPSKKGYESTEMSLMVHTVHYDKDSPKTLMNSKK